MRPQKQKFRHRPDEGIFGDCCRASIASVLDLDVDEVPHFAQDTADEGDDACNEAIETWLRGRGLTRIAFPIDGSTPLQTVLDKVSSIVVKPDVYFLLTGQSRNGVNHVVVCKDARIVWDTSLDNSGIVDCCTDGHWWVEFFGALLPDRESAAAAEGK